MGTLPSWEQATSEESRDEIVISDATLALSKGNCFVWANSGNHKREVKFSEVSFTALCEERFNISKHHCSQMKTGSEEYNKDMENASHAVTRVDVQKHNQFSL